MVSPTTSDEAAVRFQRDVTLRIEYEDKSPLGSAATQRADEAVRTIFSAVNQFVQRYGFDNLIAESPKLLSECVRSEPFQRICEAVGSRGWSLRTDILYPPPSLTKPTKLTVYGADSPSGIELTSTGDDWLPIHRVVAHLSSGGKTTKPLTGRAELELAAIFRRAGLLEQDESRTSWVASALGDSDVTFAGHNAVMVRTSSASVLIDPLLFPRSSQYPATYQPLTVRDLGRPDAVLITHSHPDHFDPATLLQIPHDTLMIVPNVGASGENILSLDLTMRLRELGFERCETLSWNHSVRVGDIEVHALAFYGEQPSDGEVLHPEVRNTGNTYVVTTPRFSAAFVADSGRDATGGVKKVALDWRREFGSVDVLFSGYRGWSTYPVQLLFSSVSRYLLFVPPELWGTRLQLMNNIAEAVDLAECWGARYLVPYGDGGAPWHWQMGLGPQLDGSGVEDPWFDPFPERVAQESRSRSRFPRGGMGRSAVESLLLRPGESLRGLPEAAEIIKVVGHTWPYRATTC